MLAQSRSDGEKEGLLKMYPEDNQNLPTVSEAEAAVLSQMSPDDRGELSVAVRQNLREILFSMIESAKGVWVSETVVKKGLNVPVPAYQKAPNMDVAQYLVNQLMGKPRETQVDFQLKQNIIVQNEIQISKMNSRDD